MNDQKNKKGRFIFTTFFDIIYYGQNNNSDHNCIYEYILVAVLGKVTFKSNA